MKITSLIQIPLCGLLRTALWAALGIVCFASAPAMASEPAWWTQQKRDCGLPSSLNYNSWDGKCNSSSNTPVYTGPSPEQLRQQREAKDSREASDDANDKGVEYYKKGDWQNAAKYFREALEYSPDDPDIRANLGKAEQKAREQETAAARASEAARQLKTVEQHSEQARPTADSNEARRGFDTGGKPAGTLGTSPVFAGAGSSNDPVVPASKRTPAITDLEKQRGESRKQVQVLEAKLKKLEPAKDAVEIVKIKQEKSTVESKVQYLNFSIGEMLDKPAQDSLTKPTK